MAHLLQHTTIHFQICDIGGHIMSKHTKYTIIQNIYDTYEAHIFLLQDEVLYCQQDCKSWRRYIIKKEELYKNILFSNLVSLKNV